MSNDYSRVTDVTDVSEIGRKTDNDRIVMHVLYGLHTLAWFSGGVFAIIAVIINYVRSSEELDPLYLGHHRYMIATFWWTLLWLVLTSPLWLLFFFPGAAAWFVVWLWYLYRCVRGWMRFSANKPV